MALAAAGRGPAATALDTVPRHHRLHVPPPLAALPSSLAVDESKYALRPSQIVLAAGRVRINVYNRGMDDHDLTLVDGNGVTQQLPVKAGGVGLAGRGAQARQLHGSTARCSPGRQSRTRRSACTT